MQEESGDGNESASQCVPKSDVPTNMESAQVSADLSNNLMKPVAANEARSFIRIMQNGSWAVGLQVSEALN